MSRTLLRHPDIVGVWTQPKDDGFTDAVEFHIRPVTNDGYDTACGLDANDPMADTFGIVDPMPAGAKITCPQCAGLWAGFKALTLRESNFKVEL